MGSETNGGVGASGIHAFDTDKNGGSGNIGLGFQAAAGILNPGDVTLKIRNATGSNIINSLELEYDIFHFNDQNGSTSFNFAWSTDDITYTSVSEVDFATIDDRDDEFPQNVSWRQDSRSLRINGVFTDELFLRWTLSDSLGSERRDEIAIDNISVTAVPEPTTLGLVGVLTGVGVFYRRRQGSRSLETKPQS